MINLTGMAIRGALVIMMAMFIAVLSWNIVQYEIVSPLADAVTTSGVSNSLTANGVSNVTSIKDFVLSFNFLFDLFAMALVFFLLSYLIGIAIEKTKLSRVAYIGSLFISLLLNVLIIFFFQDIIVWLKDSLFITFLDVELLMFFWIIDNIGFLLFTLSVALLTINQLQDYLKGRFVRQ
jgi:hypothetical protein